MIQLIPLTVFATAIAGLGYLYLYRLPTGDYFLKELSGVHLFYRCIARGIQIYAIGYLLYFFLVFLVQYAFASQFDDLFFLLKGFFVKIASTIKIGDVFFISSLREFFSDIRDDKYKVISLIYTYSDYVFPYFLALFAVYSVTDFVNKNISFLSYLDLIAQGANQHFSELDELIFKVSRGVQEDKLNGDVGFAGSQGAEDAELLQITLDSHKVYIGFPINYNLHSKNEYIELLPFYSGYRKKDTKKLEIDILYNEVIDYYSASDADKSVDMNSFYVMIPVTRVVSISTFDIDVFYNFKKKNIESSLIS